MRLVGRWMLAPRVPLSGLCVCGPRPAVADTVVWCLVPPGDERLSRLRSSDLRAAGRGRRHRMGNLYGNRGRTLHVHNGPLHHTVVLLDMPTGGPMLDRA